MLRWNEILHFVQNDKVNRDQMVAQACALIERRRVNRKRLLVAIDGCGGAGKSTLAEGIRDSLASVSIVRADDFYRPLNEYPAAALAPAQAYELYFPWQRMRDKALLPLRRGEAAKYRRYDWTSDALGAWVTVEANPIVLVEGVYASRPGIRELVDAIIFVNAPRAVRMRRMRARGHSEGDWMRPWMAAEDWYVEQVRPQERADLVLNNG